MTELSMIARAPRLADLRIEPGLPVVVSPRVGADMTLAQAGPLLHAIAAGHLERAGGVRFTGFRVESIEAFQRFAASYGDPLIGYEFASTPRSQVEGGVYTSTEYPPHRWIPLHNERRTAQGGRRDGAELPRGTMTR
ncbi:syringomycin biosynthesis enzyme [Caballeronia hypogeia]|uniref:Syringomycin biosynthesis enzyme n=1 Tax=Caballeronia hypogeia TaxID=1777140 RepID=A0A157ZDX3_9BURK|nr:syringomycin biosynthesis enzyme [Caballeronia hypogeia]